MKTPVYIFIFLLVALLFPVQVQSQTEAPATTYNGLINIKQNKAEVEGNLLKLDMDILLSGLSVGRYQTLILTPVLRKDNYLLRLSPIRINGANKHKMYERTVAFQGKQVADGDAYVVLKSAPTLLQEVNYKKEISFRPWMENAELLLLGELTDYDDIPVQTYTNVLTDRLYIRQEQEK